MRVRTIAQQTIRTHKLLALCIGLLALPVQAQKPALEAHVQMRVPRLRSLAPIPIEVRLSWQGKNLLEGHLRYELLSGPQTVAVYNTGDLALNTGDQRFHFLLPPVSDPNLSNQLLLKLSLIDRYGRIYPLGDHALGTQQSSGRSFVVAIASPGVIADKHLLNTARSLRFDDFLSEKERRDRYGLGGALSGTAWNIDPAKFPASPVGYCSYDIVALPGPGFTAMSKAQLAALARWVRGGGSVCVLPDSKSRFKPWHLEFLNLISNRNTAADKYLLDADGNLVAPEAAAGSPFDMNDTAFGRSVIVLRPPPNGKELLADVGWRQARAFLWRIRWHHLNAVMQTGTWQRPAAASQRAEAYMQFMPDLDDQTVGQMRAELMPEEVQVMPLWVIATILVLFVLAIGPVDYIVLGKLNMRRFTWVLFPLTSIVFTVFTVVLARYYMGSKDYRNAIEIIDLDQRGVPLRSNRVELIYVSRAQTVTTDVRSGIFNEIGWLRTAHSGSDALPATCNGQIPTRYSVDQYFNQWSPKVNRIFSFDVGDQAVAGLDFRELGRRPHPDELEKEIQKRIASGKIDGMLWYNHLHDDSAHGGGELDNDISAFIRMVTERARTTLFQVLFQISPRGGDNFEDLAILDPKDPVQHVLVVVTKKDNDTIVYRQRFTTQSRFR